MPKAKRVSYDASFKLSAIRLAIVKGNRKAASELGINESMVRKWRLQKDQLSVSAHDRRAYRGQQARWPNLEEELAEWVHTQRADGRGLSMVHIRLKAVQMAKQKGLEGFSGNATWCFRFMHRKGMSLRSLRTKTALCQQLPADIQVQLTEFREFINGIILEHAIGGDSIVSMDEVPLTFDIPVMRIEEGESSLKTNGCEKTCFTVVLSCCCSGKKLLPMVIFKRNRMPKAKFPPGIVVKVNPNGWMTEQLMIDWLKECYCKRPDGFLHRRKAMVLMDSMRAHTTEPVKEIIDCLNSIPAIIPTGTTKVLQPLDISVKRCFKSHLRQMWKQRMSEGDHFFTKGGRLRRASLPEVCQWILLAWQQVSIKTITNGFKKAKINRADEPADDTHCEDSSDAEGRASTSTNGEGVDMAAAGTAVVPSLLDLCSVFVSDSEESEFSGFSADESFMPVSPSAVEVDVDLEQQIADLDCLDNGSEAGQYHSDTETRARPVSPSAVKETEREQQSPNPDCLANRSETSLYHSDTEARTRTRPVLLSAVEEGTELEQQSPKPDCFSNRIETSQQYSDSDPSRNLVWSSQSDSMSEGRPARLEVGDYVAYSTADQDMNGAEQSDVTGIQVKFEVEDPEYDQPLGANSVTAGLLRSFPPSAVASSQSAAQWSGQSSAVRTQLRKIIEDKSAGSSATVQNVQSVIEDLLKKNEYLLAKNDAQGYKPHSRRGRLPGELGRSREVMFPGPGQSTTFNMGTVTQGRISLASNLPLDQTSAVGMGQLMRPKSPTRKCVIPERDKSHFNLALMESQVGGEEGEKIFRVREHELVCAISSQTKFLSNEGQLVSSLDINYYWCNFCSFSTANKALLLQHVMDHRFSCKHCRYQSFSRADVIHHSTHSHPNFQDTAAITQYCTLLSDYLRILNPKEANLDQQRKRKEPPEEEKGNGDQPSAKVSRNGPGKVRTKKLTSLSSSYDVYNVCVEDLEEQAGEDEAGTVSMQDGGSKSIPTSTSVTIPSADTTSQTQTAAVTSNVTVQSTSSSLTPSPAPEVGQPIITQVFSASNIPAALVPDGPSSSSQQTSATDPASKASTPTTQSSASSSFFPNSLGAGAMQQMRSNLYWSCGYCKFTSTSQSGIKDHSVRQHSGKPHRYVALIKPEECSTPPPAKQVEEPSASADQTPEADSSGEGVADSVTVTQTEPPTSTEAKEASVVVKQEPVTAEETAAHIRVRFPTPRIQSKDTSTLKCYHCNYASRNLGPLRNHILNRHKGKCLVGLGGTSSKVFMCTRSDCIFRSSSGQNFISHAKDCTPWLDKKEAEAPVEAHIFKCLRETLRLAEEGLPPGANEGAGTGSSKAVLAGEASESST